MHSSLYKEAFTAIDILGLSSIALFLFAALTADLAPVAGSVVFALGVGVLLVWVPARLFVGIKGSRPQNR